MTIRFGTDGWRAVIGWEYTADNVRACAAGTAQYLKKNNLAERGLLVGYDTRFLSEEFAAEVAGVATAMGVPTYLCNAAAPTPVVSYNVVDRQAGGAAIITASHNPAKWNGYKYKPEYGGSASTEEVEELESEINRIPRDSIQSLSPDEAGRQGVLEYIDASTPYLRHVAKLVDLPSIKGSGLKVAVDAMHGAGAGYLPQLLDGGSTAVTELRGERNPAFPSMQQPEPVAHNLAPLSQWIRSNGADIGIALDGDADRVGLVDEKGRFITTLQTFTLLALYLLEQRQERGPLVKSTTMTSMIYRLGKLFDVPVYETAVGFKFLGPVMMRENALTAGEESGGFAFRGHVPERDGILSGLFLLDMVVKTGKRPSELLDYLFSKLGPHYYDRLDLPFSPENRQATEKRVGTQRPDALGGSRVVSRDETDGVRFMMEDSAWLLIRFSGTEPLLRIYAEAASEDGVKLLLDEGRNLAGV